MDRNRLLCGLVASAALSVASCGGGGNTPTAPSPPPSPSAKLEVALTSDSRNPITGRCGSENLLNWEIAATLREVGGVGVRITRGADVVGIRPDGGRVTYAGTLDWIVEQFGSDRIPANGTLSGRHSPCYTSTFSALEVTYHGVDDNGNNVSATGRVTF